MPSKERGFMQERVNAILLEKKNQYFMKLDQHVAYLGAVESPRPKHTPTWMDYQARLTRYADWEHRVQEIDPTKKYSKEEKSLIWRDFEGLRIHTYGLRVLQQRFALEFFGFKGYNHEQESQIRNESVAIVRKAIEKAIEKCEGVIVRGDNLWNAIVANSMYHEGGNASGLQIAANWLDVKIWPAKN